MPCMLHAVTPENNYSENPDEQISAIKFIRHYTEYCTENLKELNEQEIRTR